MQWATNEAPLRLGESKLQDTGALQASRRETGGAFCKSLLVMRIRRSLLSLFCFLFQCQNTWSAAHVAL